jgi:formate dehydrogenase subunit delta
MKTTEEKLRYMADQIARNFCALDHDNAVLATADHINQFWDPRMKAMIFADGEIERLTPVARAAIAKLAAGIKPASQTRATVFAEVDEGGHSDAG